MNFNIRKRYFSKKKKKLEKDKLKHNLYIKV